MFRRPVLRVLAAVLGGLAVGVSLLALLMLINASSGLEGAAATTAFGWTIPLIAGVLVGTAAWLLLLDRGVEVDRRHDLRESTCSVCGNPIIAEWRLCPHCGTVTEPLQRSAPRPAEQPAVQ